MGDDRAPKSEETKRRSSSEPSDISSDLAAIQAGCFMRNIYIFFKSQHVPLVLPTMTHTLLQDSGCERHQAGGGAMKGCTPRLLLSITLAGRRLPWGGEESGGGAERHWDLAYIHSSGPAEQREEQDARQSERKMRQQD